MAKKKAQDDGKRRTRGHIIADLSVHHVEGHVLRCGWTLQRIQHDYGLDLVLSVYSKEGTSQPSGVFLQVKASDGVKYVHGGEAVAVRVERAHLRAWLREALPVILVMYDAQEDAAYWLYVQAYFEKLEGFNVEDAGKLVTVHIPTTNVLDEEAIRQFARFRDLVLDQLAGVVHHAE